LNLGIFVARLLNESITRNVVKLTETARELQAGNLDAQAHLNSVDEIGQLASTFNAMAAGIASVIGAIGEYDRSAAEVLHVLAEHFKYEELLSCIQDARGQNTKETQ
jgi:methyl-accepting chemotaxis protein